MVVEAAKTKPNLASQDNLLQASTETERPCATCAASQKVAGPVCQLSADVSASCILLQTGLLVDKLCAPYIHDSDQGLG